MGQNVKKELLDGKVKIIVSFPRLEMSYSLSFWKVHPPVQCSGAPLIEETRIQFENLVVYIENIFFN